MHVLMLSWEYPPHVVGGIGTHVAGLLPALARRGVDVTLITPRFRGGDPSSDIEENARVYRVEPPIRAMGNFYADALQTNVILEAFGHSLWPEGDHAGESKTGFDLIHAHDWLVGSAANSLKQLHKTPLVATMHATERGRGRGALNGEMAQAINGAEWWLAYESWRIITASHFMAEEVRRYFDLPPDKIDIVPNGVETAPWDRLAAADLSDFRRSWVRPDQQIIFFIGRLQYEKGPQVLVEAASHVLRDVPRAKFILAGSGGMMDSLRRRVSELGMAESFALPGYISDDDKDRLYKVANVAVFPSLYEPFGIVALEAMAARCPVVVTDIGGLREVVRNGETGLIVHADDPGALAWGITETLRKRDQATERAALAYQVVREEYNWDRIAERTIQVYDRVIAERSQVNWA